MSISNHDNILITSISSSADDSLLLDDDEDVEISGNDIKINILSKVPRSKPNLKKKIPQYVCLSIFAVVILTCVFNLEEVKMIYHGFIDWIRVNPYLAVCAIIVFYVVSVCLNMPIVQSHVALGYTYS